MRSVETSGLPTIAAAFSYRRPPSWGVFKPAVHPRRPYGGGIERRVEVRELKLLADKYAKRAADLGQAR